MNEPICFVPTGADHKSGEFMVSGDPAPLVRMTCDQPGWPGYRRLPTGWLDGASERMARAYAEHFGPRGMVAMHLPRDIFIAALFPPSEPEPPDWAVEAAGSSARFILPGGTCIDARALARHFAAVYAKHQDGSK